jgi:hypothetical protein
MTPLVGRCWLHRLLGLGLVLVGGGMTGAGPVHAAIVAQWHGSPDGPGGFDGPRLAGDHVVWAAGPTVRGGSWTVASALVDGGAARVLVQSPTPSPPGVQGTAHALQVLASPEAVVYEDAGASVDNGKYMRYTSLYDRVQASMGNGPFVGLGVSCAGDPFLGFRTPLALDAGRLASLPRCGGEQRIQILDLAAPDLSAAGFGIPIDVPPAGRRAEDLRLAGQFVAYTTTQSGAAGTAGGTEIVVVDLRSGASRIAWISTPGQQLLTWDLRADGSLALASGPDLVGSVGQLAWIDPDGAGHPLGADVTRDPIQFVGDQIAAFLTSGPHDRQSGDDFSTRTLSLVGLDGAARPMARLGGHEDWDNQPHAAGLDFDGDHVVWAERQCETLSVRSLAATAVSLAAPVTDVCLTPHVSSTRASVDRNGRFQLRVNCLPGCSGTLRILNPARAADRPKKTVALHPFRLAPRIADHLVTLWLNARGRRLLRATEELNVRVRLHGTALATSATPTVTESIIPLYRAHL